ncbi:hypothetical protein C8A05DRAFT_31696 [Staphylotrichum tortipilum]|uniref:Integral membrane protein n=1 Tax=Staphylotrichum tortipilum TaxID=2831512 RepID=A0AAN6MP61_9PEZI|nr:hypothetical protein C8A05DRAFT_31696 [Staphylotrichum longicolle]
METTLFPVATLPPCATKCGALYDVNGACVPPAAPTADASTYDSCFCNDQRLAPFKSGTSGVCDQACAANNDLASIQNWFTNFCDNVPAADNQKPTTTGTSSTGRPASGASNQGGGGGGGNTWLSNHYQWVIFLVIMVVAIIGIWVGACIWRRRYVRKKDRVYALGTNLARATESGRVVPNTSAASIHVPAAGMFDPAPISSAGVYGEKPEKSKKKWIVRDRT